MRLVGAFEAKNKLGQLLDLVEQGEEITITRHGKEVARLVPAQAVRNQLELALRRSLPLATLDDELRAAATALGLRLLGAD